MLNWPPSTAVAGAFLGHGDKERGIKTCCKVRSAWVISFWMSAWLWWWGLSLLLLIITINYYYCVICQYVDTCHVFSQKINSCVMLCIFTQMSGIRLLQSQRLMALRRLQLRYPFSRCGCEVSHLLKSTARAIKNGGCTDSLASTLPTRSAWDPFLFWNTSGTWGS